jgi:hypothetical protein
LQNLKVEYQNSPDDFLSFMGTLCTRWQLRSLQCFSCPALGVGAADQIAETVGGARPALYHSVSSGAAEQRPEVTTIVCANGPLFILGQPGGWTAIPDSKARVTRVSVENNLCMAIMWSHPTIENG